MWVAIFLIAGPCVMGVLVDSILKHSLVLKREPASPSASKDGVLYYVGYYWWRRNLIGVVIHYKDGKQVIASGNYQVVKRLVVRLAIVLAYVV